VVSLSSARQGRLGYLRKEVSKEVVRTPSEVLPRVAQILEIEDFDSGAEGIRTPDLRRAKSGTYYRGCSLLFKIACKTASS
jgi:hypothetical protein